MKKTLGKKSGEGFYSFAKKEEAPSSTVEEMISQVSKKKMFHSDDCVERMMLIMINEAARCLEENIVESAGDIDVGMIFGTGFPAFRGGLLRYADELGIDILVTKLEHYQKSLKADRFIPCDYILKLKEQEKSFFNA